MTLIEKALQLAVSAHKDQVRKSDGSPYVVHPIMVGMLLKEHGFTETVIAAAITHDVLEDTAVTPMELADALGSEVARIVAGVSEDKSLEWEARKEAYAHAVAAADEAIKAVSVADKIHNAESMISDYPSKGKDVWKPFNRGKDKKIWFEELVYTELKKTWNHPLLDRYAKAIEQLKQFEE